MRRVAAGDRSAFSVLLDKYMAQVFRFSLGLLNDSALAEDATQECFVKLWQNAAQWKPEGKLKSWLLRIAHNLCIDELRLARNSKPHTQVDGCEDIVLLSPQTDPRQNAQIRQVSDIVRNALSNLPERQRAALMLVYYSECTNKEAAAIMQISEDAIESLLARGRRGLHDILKEKKNDLLEG